MNQALVSTVRPLVSVRPLADLLGQTVLVDAYLSTWRELDHQVQICLSHVELSDYSTGLPLRTIDHAWIWISMKSWRHIRSAHQKHPLTLQEHVKGAAKVIRYTRSGGSQDYGLKSTDMFGTDEMIKQQSRHSSQSHTGLAHWFAEIPLAELENTVASIQWTMDCLQKRELDWRLYGRNPSDAITNLKAHLSLATQAKERRLKAQQRLPMAKRRPSNLSFKTMAKKSNRKL